MIIYTDKELLLTATGDKYEGEFKDGLINGQGTYTFADGTIQKGIFKNEEFVGN